MQKDQQAIINQDKAGEAIFTVPDETIQCRKKDGLYVDKKEQSKSKYGYYYPQKTI